MRNTDEVTVGNVQALGANGKAATTSRRVITSNEPCLSSCEPQIINNIQFPSRCLGDNKSNKLSRLKPEMLFVLSMEDI